MNMDMLTKVILAILETFIFFGFGAWAYRLKLIEDGDLGRLGRLSIDMLLPFLTFSSIVRNFTAKDLAASGDQKKELNDTAIEYIRAKYRSANAEQKKQLEKKYGKLGVFKKAVGRR